MSISSISLKSHIQTLNAGTIDFSNVDMNLRADLVRFNGYSIEEASKLTTDEVDAAIYQVDKSEYEYSFETKCKCEECKSNLFEVDYTDWNDNYTLLCKSCNSTLSLHYTSYDAWREGIEQEEKFEKEALPLVKLLCKHCALYMGITAELKKSILNNGILIQKFDNYGESQEYYQMDGRFYLVGCDTGEFKPSNNKAYELFIDEVSKI
ncbi:hypothetical protein NST33_18445 [Paenibacillus sp. FSL L8-0435]|uniref:hypothetical protein n=1 Tax=Paenibacillus sp. FSL L8-0435 TaxID=2954618 RepID=UPI0030DACD59